MNEKLQFYMTDVFAQQKYSGNQLMTFLDAAHVPGEVMQKMAREINFSETTFILSREPRDGGYDVRIFTPGSEVDFAGHPTLGTAYIIRKHIIEQPVKEVVLNLKVGQVPVFFPNGSGAMWMHQVEPIFGKPIETGFMAQVLDLNEEDFDSRFPIEPVSTGLPFNIVPLKNMDALKRAATVKKYYDQMCETSMAKGIVVFCPGGYSEEQDLAVRVFVDYYGIPEDPATGSGTGCLGGYLVKHRYFGKADIDIKTGQGYEIGRPSLLSLKAREEAGHIKIEVGGEVISVAEGLWT
jgi:trans-2,3-dihydro-3-hydroxyanthranilate isomerase